VSARRVTFVAYSFRRSSSGSLAKFIANHRASSRVIRFGRRAVRRRDMSGIGGEAESSDFLRAFEQSDRAFNIDPPASSYAIMRRARPYRGENSEPGKDDRGESLTPRPGIREHHRPEGDARRWDFSFGLAPASAAQPTLVVSRKLTSGRWRPSTMIGGFRAFTPDAPRTW
jgi:hypothetical protein